MIGSSKILDENGNTINIIVDYEIIECEKLVSHFGDEPKYYIDNEENTIQINNILTKNIDYCKDDEEFIIHNLI